MDIVTIFRSRLRPGVEDDYRHLAEEMSERARRAPGFVEERFYLGADGERVTLVRFADHDSHQAWAEDPVHRAAQRRGRDDLYEWYEVSVCEELSTRRFEGGLAAPGKSAAGEAEVPQ
ncbi:MAG: antibiotic biosynthesis monooxygenase family protein [Acidimicrobiales bacterium]